jgi:hypothetical protein
MIVAGAEPSSAAEDAVKQSAPKSPATLPLDPYHGLTQDQLIALLSSDEESVVAFRIASMMTDTRNQVVCDTLRSLWLGRPSSALPARSMELASIAQVRIALAATLSRCKGASADPAYRTYLRSVLMDASAQETDRIRAASNLGIAGDDGDVPVLRDFAMSGNNLRLALGAIGGLSAIKSPLAQRTLSEIAASPTVDEKVRRTAQRLQAK